MTSDKVKLLKHSDNKQLGRKAFRLVQLNLRFCILLLLLLITVFLITHLSRSLRRQPKDVSLNEFAGTFLDAISPQTVLKHPSNDSDDVSYEEFDLVWSEETVELLQDQLGIVIDDEVKSLQCHVGQEYLVSALPGVDDLNLVDNLWQYFSLIALESQSRPDNEENSKLSLKAFATEQMRVVLNQLFEGLSIQTLSNLPPTCYDLQHAQIIGNKSPINLNKIVPPTSLLLLDPKAKRIKEIAQLFGSKMRPFLRFNKGIMKEVQQEFLVTKTIQEVENQRNRDVNFVGLYITSEDKLPIEYYQSALTFHRKMERTIFIIVCDSESFKFCKKTFEDKKGVGDGRVLRASTEMFDFALLSSCNSTIVSNEIGVLHALINGGDTTVHKPEIYENPEYYIPLMISEFMPNFYVVD